MTNVPRAPITCPHKECGYTWTPRVDNPVKCRLCQRWMNKPTPKPAPSAPR